MKDELELTLIGRLNVGMTFSSVLYLHCINQNHKNAGDRWFSTDKPEVDCSKVFNL